jgi:hypothetical protein
MSGASRGADAAAIERIDGYEPGALDPRNGASRLEEACRKCESWFAARVPRRRQTDFDRRQVPRFDPEVGADEPLQVVGHQASGEEED